jgi:hypothetical protein
MIIFILHSVGYSSCGLLWIALRGNSAVLSFDIAARPYRRFTGSRFTDKSITVIICCNKFALLIITESLFITI